MADYSPKPPRSLAAIKASVIIMAVLIVVGLVVIAAKLLLDLGEATQSTAKHEPDGSAKVVHMVGVGDRVVLVVESPSGDQSLKILDPQTEKVSEVPIDGLVE